MAHEEKITYPQQGDRLGVEGQVDSYQPSPILSSPTGFSDGPVSRQQSPQPPQSTQLEGSATPNVSHPGPAQNVSPDHTGNPDITPAAPPTYNDVLEERYGVAEKPNAPQNQPPTMVTPLTALGRESTMVDCPRCRQAVKTRTEKHSGHRAFTWGAIICICLGCLCAWIPCVMDDCKDTEQYCSKCNLALATVSAGGAVQLSPAARQAMQVASQAPAGNTQQPSVNQAHAPSTGQSPPAQQQSHTQPPQQPQPVNSSEQYVSPSAPIRQNTRPVDENGKPLPEMST